MRFDARALLVLVSIAATQAGCASAFSPAGSANPGVGRGTNPTLAPALDRLLDSRPFHRTLWGLEFLDVRSGRTLYERNAHRHFVPASGMKLLVTAAALDRLGPEYTYRTSLYAEGIVREGTLAGDLVLYGRGDPNLSGRYTMGRTAIFSALADSLKARGVRRITGRIVTDESYFDADYTRPDWEAYDLLWWYAAPVSALSFNDNSIDFTVRPGAPGSPPTIVAEPPSSFYTLRNTARTVAPGDSIAVPLDFTRLPGTNHIVAYGEVSADAAEETESFAVLNPATWTGTVFRETLEAQGIAVDGDSVVVVSDPALSPVDSASTLLAEHVSPPLEKVIVSINQRSQNWHAEQLLKTLGKILRGEGSFAAGIAVEREFLDSIGVEPDEVHIRDASGLSDGNLVTPHALVTLLGHMLRDPHAATFFGSLPVAGGEGSLRFRFASGPAAGAVHAKTGTIAHVNSLTGYLIPTPSDTLAFSVVANNHGLESGQVIAAIDSALAIVAGAYR